MKEIFLKIIFITMEKLHGSMEIHMMALGEEVNLMAQEPLNAMMDAF